MDNLFADMSKFGINVDDDMQLFEEEKKDTGMPGTGRGGSVARKLTEEDFIIEKIINCPLCDVVSKVKVVKASKAKRLEPDRDLRPRYQGVDANKYGVTVCTHCGYAALDKYFKPLPSAQEKLIREKISMNFNGSSFKTALPTYSYDMAVERYKLALLNCVVKKGKVSERAYLCLRTAWVYRGMAENLDQRNPDYADMKAECNKMENEFLKNALEGFIKASMSESYPICGMDEATVDYLITALAVNFKKYDIASKCLARILSSSQANRRIKDKAYDLKQEIIEEMKKQKQ